MVLRDWQGNYSHLKTQDVSLKGGGGNGVCRLSSINWGCLTRGECRLLFRNLVRVVVQGQFCFKRQKPEGGDVLGSRLLRPDLWWARNAQVYEVKPSEGFLSL